MKKLILYICLIVLLGANAWLLWQGYPYVKSYGRLVSDKIHASDVKIFMTYHKPYQLPFEQKILQPIQVGRAVEREPFFGGQLSDKNIEWLHAHTIGDDTGDNISAKNRSFDVLTAYYWVWKHYKEIGNPKYIGFLAHRKIFMLTDNDVRNFRRFAPDYGYTEQELKKLLEEHKIITYFWATYHEDAPVSVYEEYFYSHHIEDLNAMIASIKRHYPEMVPVMEDVLHNVHKEYAIWNFWIMEKELAWDYFEKLFPIMFEVEKERSAEIAEYDLEQRRVFGYLAERFFAIWVEYQTRLGKADPLFAGVRYL